MTHNKNKIVSLDGKLEQSIEGSWFIHKVGLPYSTFYVKEYAGVDPQTGKAMFGTGDERVVSTLKDISNVEFVVLASLAVVVIVLGVFPSGVLEMVNSSLKFIYSSIKG
jgi:NADH:ubiquinone oxidoreductase subunit 4 (subunit M)